MNEALTGYTDPNTKILLMTNERGNPIARSIFRILTDEQGNPVLHAETIYTSDASDGVARAIYRHAVEKGKAMGMPVYISTVSQNADGHVAGIREVEGVTFSPTQATLASHGSRAPVVYVDSSSGKAENSIHATYYNAQQSFYPEGNLRADLLPLTPLQPHKLQ